MAIPLSAKPNVQAPSTLYPYGNIQDDDGSDNGTPVNTVVYADFHQYFAKLLDISGIAANGEVENHSNGFQYIDALQKIIQEIASVDWIDLTPINGWGGGAVLLSARKQFGLLQFKGELLHNTGVTTPAFTLPIGLRPDVKKHMLITYDDGSAAGDIQVVINTDGTVVPNLQQIPSTGEISLWFDISVPIS